MGINIDDILKAAIRVGASDIHIGTGRHPILRVEGKLMPVKNAPKLTADDVKSMAYSMMNPAQREKFEDLFEMDLAYSISGLSRFRVNIFQQRGSLSIAISCASISRCWVRPARASPPRSRHLWTTSTRTGPGT